MNRRDALCLVGSSVTALTTVPRLLASSAAAATAPTGPTTVQQLDTFLNGFHVHKQDPSNPVETNHHCMRLSEDLWQCVIFHGTSPKLIGVEYLITDRLYRSLPLEEKAYWHPHSYEVLAGQLIAPNLSAKREADLMRDLVTTWGKTWQTWPDPTTDVPEGEPQLLWSVTQDGQLSSELLASRDRRFAVSTRTSRTRRQELGYPVPHVEPPQSVQEIGRQWSGTEPRRT